MPHAPEDKKRALSRLRRIRGQAEALERAIAAETECGLLLQQIAALRGAANGLMADVLDSHLRETLGSSEKKGLNSAKLKKEDIESLIKILRTYLK